MPNGERLRLFSAKNQGRAGLLQNTKNDIGNFNKEFEINQDLALVYAKQIFADVATGKLTYEAKRAVERVGINALDLIEKTEEEFNYRAQGEKEVTAEMV